MKPSEEIKKKLQKFLAEAPDFQELVKGGNEDMIAVAMSVAMIQMILNWLDEKFPPNHV